MTLHHISSFRQISYHSTQPKSSHSTQSATHVA